jgi:IS4 transposase
MIFVLRTLERKLLIFKEVPLLAYQETRMSLAPEFTPFIQGAPCTVMTRLAAEWMLDDQALAQLFDTHAVDQYQREITLSNLVNVMLDVACGTRRSPRAAYLARKEEIAASLSAFYGKLNRTEPALGQALVAHSAERGGELIHALGGARAEPVRGFQSFILDGNMLAGTDHRLEPLRGTRAAALPGKSLALYECATGLVKKAILWEDAHSQERALLPDLTFEAGWHVIADRNFCVTWFLANLESSGAYFTVRQHRGSMPLESLETVGKRRRCGRCETGVVYEQTIRVVHQGKEFFWRMITLKLDQPTRDGEIQIVLISNLPARVRAQTIAMIYRLRWSIEGHFQRLTDWLHCEVPTLAYPRAALFAFAMSLVAGNLLAIVIAGIRAVHGDDLADNLSYCVLADEAGGAYRGMMLALPPERWEGFQAYTPKQMARLLRQVARHTDAVQLRKTVRGPKKPRRTPNCKKIRHVSTHRVLQKQLTKSC